MGAVEVEAFLNHLAINRGLSGATQNQAFSALLFLYGQALKIELKGIDAKRAKTRKLLPVVLSVAEVKEFLRAVPEGTPRTLVGLLYGCGLRVSEALRLRVKDVDFGNGLVWIRDGKGGKDRSLSMPAKLAEALRRQVERSRILFEQDEERGGARVWVEPSLDRKYGHGPSRNWTWFWVFAAEGRSVDPRDGKRKRHHLMEVSVSRWISRAVKEAGIEKRVSAHTLRHSYATHLIRSLHPAG